MVATRSSSPQLTRAHIPKAVSDVWASGGMRGTSSGGMRGTSSGGMRGTSSGGMRGTSSGGMRGTSSGVNGLIYMYISVCI